jgi:hypothetical protein
MYYKLDLKVIESVFVEADSEEDAQEQFSLYLEGRGNDESVSAMLDEQIVADIVSESDFEDDEIDHVMYMREMRQLGDKDEHSTLH